MAETGSLLGFTLLLVALLRFALFAVALGAPALAAARLVTRCGGGASRRGVTAAGLGPHDHLGALAQLVGAVDHDAIAGLDSREDFDTIALSDAELHRPHGHRAVLLEQVDKGAGYAALDAGGRHRDRVLVRVEQRRMLTNWFGNSF